MSEPPIGDGPHRHVSPTPRSVTGIFRSRVSPRSMLYFLNLWGALPGFRCARDGSALLRVDGRSRRYRRQIVGGRWCHGLASSLPPRRLVSLGVALGPQDLVAAPSGKLIEGFAGPSSIASRLRVGAAIAGWRRRHRRGRVRGRRRAGRFVRPPRSWSLSPAKASRMIDPRREQSRMASATSATGFTVGCILRSSIRPARKLLTPA